MTEMPLVARAWKLLDTFTMRTRQLAAAVAVPLAVEPLAAAAAAAARSWAAPRRREGSRLSVRR